MSSRLARLETELRRTLSTLEDFQEFRGAAVDHASLKLIIDNKTEGQEVEVAVLDATGHIYRGWVTGESKSQVAFEVHCHDGEFVSGVTANQILTVRIADKK